MQNKLLFIFSVLCVVGICCKQQPVFSQKIKSYDLVRDFGAVADNKTDNYLAFAKAAEALSSAGGGILNIPKGKYYVEAYKGIGKKKSYTANDIVFKNCNNLTITGNNSEVRLNGNFSRNRDYQVPGLDHYYAYNNTVCLFKFKNSKNVLLKDITLYGEVDKMKKQTGVAEGESFGVNIADDAEGEVSSNILLQGVTAHHFASDGFIINSNGKNIVLDRCNAYNNARQGLSIVKGNNIKVLNSSFDSTGHTGAYGWHAPGAGIDVENEFGAGKLSDVLIRNCNLRGNKGFQLVTTLSSNKVILDSSFISDLTAGYSDALNGIGMYSLNSVISNCIIFAGIQVDLSDQIYKGPKEQEINRNIIYSGDRGIVSADFGRAVNITDNILIMLPKPKLETYFPYIQNYNCRFNRNLVVVHADRLKKDPNQVTALVQSVKEVKGNFWLINGFDIPEAKQKSVYFIPAVNGSVIIEDQFFSASDLVSRFSIPQRNVLTAAQVKKILTAEIFTAYHQKKFNRDYLLQAAVVRKYQADMITASK